MRRLLSILLLFSAFGLLGRGHVGCEAFPAQPRCFVALHPGPAQDALTAVFIRGARTYASAGELLLTTVAVDPDLAAAEWVRHLWSPRVRLVARTELYPPGDDTDEVRRRNVAEMDRSQVAAAVAALRTLGHAVDLAPDGARVVEVVAGSPAEATLALGDVIVSVDGDPVHTADAATQHVRDRAPGDVVSLRIRRDGDLRTVTVRLAPHIDDPDRPLVGALLTDHLSLPVDVRIEAGQVGGPSAGLMFALAVIDALTAKDLTGGAVIAGTGVIDEHGVVGAIGGIQQKILGAVHRDDDRGASAFLVPRGNLDEARSTRVGREILVIPVGTLQEALDALEQLRGGRRPPDAVALGRS
ncbi:MAG: PDZ domain-containing protein [Actinobacteria bacterium]|nr:PDZ domain-containing protein [Actinomycetota bacterium]